MFLDECAVGGQILGPAAVAVAVALALALEPAIEPADDLPMEIGGVDLRDMGILVLPRPNQRAGRRGQVRGERRRGVDVGVRPAADGQHRRLDGLPVLADRAVPPVGIAGRMVQPAGGEEGQRFNPLHPAFAPVVAQHRIGRSGLVGQHLGAPVEVVGQQAAAHVVDVVGIAVDGGAAGDDRLQRRRPAKCELQCVEPAPGDPDHRDAAVAPRLARDPGDHLFAVRKLLLRVFVVEDTVRISGAGYVDSDTGIARRGEHRMGGGVARRGAVALAVRQVLQNRRSRGVSRRPP